MTADQIDNTVRKMLENLDREVHDILEIADKETLVQLKDEFWVRLINIDIDGIIEQK
jgi:hypothetical protein